MSVGAVLQRLADLAQLHHLVASRVTIAQRDAPAVGCDVAVAVDYAGLVDTAAGALDALDRMWAWSNALAEPIVTKVEGDTYALSVHAAMPDLPCSVTVVARMHRSVFVPVEPVAVGGAS